jgi:hypothetical protein
MQNIYWHKGFAHMANTVRKVAYVCSSRHVQPLYMKALSTALSLQFYMVAEELYLLTFRMIQT